MVLGGFSFFFPLVWDCVQSADITGYQFIKGQSFQLVSVCQSFLSSCHFLNVFFFWLSCGKVNQKREGKEKVLTLVKNYILGKKKQQKTTKYNTVRTRNCRASTPILTLWLNYTIFTLAADTTALPQQFKIFGKSLKGLSIRINWNILVPVGAWLKSWLTLKEYSIL